jgi:hypothetical protein
MLPFGEWAPVSVAVSVNDCPKPMLDGDAPEDGTVLILGLALFTVTTSFEHALEALLLLPSPG